MDKKIMVHPVSKNASCRIASEAEAKRLATFEKPAKMPGIAFDELEESKEIFKTDLKAKKA